MTCWHKVGFKLLITLHKHKLINLKQMREQSITLGLKSNK